MEPQRLAERSGLGSAAIKRRDLVRMNGGSLLLGAIREMVLTITSRSARGPVELPTVDARMLTAYHLTRCSGFPLPLFAKLRPALAGGALSYGVNESSLRKVVPEISADCVSYHVGLAVEVGTLLESSPLASRLADYFEGMRVKGVFRNF
jgi:hypothetical protein